MDHTWYFHKYIHVRFDDKQGQISYGKLHTWHMIKKMSKVMYYTICHLIFQPDFNPGWDHEIWRCPLLVCVWKCHAWFIANHTLTTLTKNMCNVCQWLVLWLRVDYILLMYLLTMRLVTLHSDKKKLTWPRKCLFKGVRSKVLVEK